MTWHLKNRKLEAKLIAIDPRFRERLCKVCENLDTNKDGDFPWYLDCSVALRHNSKRIGEVVFHSDDVEKIPEYNPHGWNEYPKVIPPENVRMRVEFKYKNKPEKTYHACFYFFSGKWYWDTCQYSIDSSIGNIRFRPWKD